MVTIDINSSLLWQIANFLILMLAMNYLLYKPIRGMLKKRSEKMAALNGEITASVEGAKSKEEELDSRRSEARREGVAVAEEMKSEGRAKERELIDAATKEMEQTVAKVREEIQGEIGQARDQLKEEVRAFGKELAQKILGRSIQ